jgi:hypothetical protein
MPRSTTQIQLEMFRRMSPDQKIALAAQLRESNLALLAAGIRSRRGSLPAEELRLEILKTILPKRLFEAGYRPR